MKQLPDDMLHHFWQDSKKEAPAGFSDFIMQNLPQETPLPEALKKPLLSPRAAGLLIGLLAVLAVSLSRLKGSSEPAAKWQLVIQGWLSESLGWIGAHDAVLPTLAVLSVAIVTLMGLDQLLQRLLKPSHGH